MTTYDFDLSSNSNDIYADRGDSIRFINLPEIPVSITITRTSNDQLYALFGGTSGTYSLTDDPQTKTITSTAAYDTYDVDVNNQSAARGEKDAKRVLMGKGHIHVNPSK